MNNTIHIDATLDRFSETFHTFKHMPHIGNDLDHTREYRIIQLRWLELTLSLMHDHAMNTLKLIDRYEEEDDAT